MIIESAITDIANPIETASSCCNQSLTCFFANFPANASDTTREIPNSKI